MGDSISIELSIFRFGAVFLLCCPDRSLEGRGLNLKSEERLFGQHRLAA